MTSPPEQIRVECPGTGYDDCNPWELTVGEDFACRMSTFIANARAQAKRRGGTVRTRTPVDGGATRVIVQFIRAAVAA